MKIVIDSYIPYIKGVLDGVAEVTYLPFREITPEAVRDADALVVRTRTRCDGQLLAGSRVKFIASATIGYDHIDAAYCRAHGIGWTNAPGCNALSVVQYVASALSFLSLRRGWPLAGRTLGVVGVGAVGSRVAAWGERLGMRVLRNDPPRARREGCAGFATLQQVCEEADIVTFHTLLNREGEDATYYLGNDAFFRALRRRPVVVNAARGEIVETAALLRALDEGRVADVVIDCWEHEPDVDHTLLDRAALATPHIAGYSADGKANAAMQSVRAVSRFFGLGLDDWMPDGLPAPYDIDREELADVRDFFLRTYDIEADSRRLKEHPEQFEQLRSNYPFRREPVAYLDGQGGALMEEVKRIWTGL